MWVAGVEAADVSSNNYAYAAWSTHGNYYPPTIPATFGATGKAATPATNAYVDTFVLEGTRSAFILPGSDGHSETILFCDRMWDFNPRNLPNWGSTKGLGGSHYTANSRSVGGVPTGAVKAPPTSGAITPTTTQFSTDYTSSSSLGSRVDMTTGATAGQFGYLVETAVSATVAAGGTSYQVGDVLTSVGGWSVVQSGSNLPSSATANPATWTVSSVSGGAVTGVTVNNPGAYLTLPAATVSTTGGSGTGCTLTPTYTPPWSGSPAYAINLYPPLSQAPAAGDQLVISAHNYTFYLAQVADALQAVSFHAPTAPTVSGSSASWTLPQDSSQGCAIHVVYPSGATLAAHDESDISRLISFGGPNPAGTALNASEIHYQVQVEPSSTAFPSGTTPVFSVILTAVHTYDSGYAPTDTSVSSNGGRGAGRPGELVWAPRRAGDVRRPQGLPRPPVGLHRDVHRDDRDLDRLPLRSRPVAIQLVHARQRRLDAADPHGGWRRGDRGVGVWIACDCPLGGLT